MNRFSRTVAPFLVTVTISLGNATAADETPNKTQNGSPGGVEKVERGVVKGAKAAGRGIEHAAEATARGVKRGGQAAARGIKGGAEAVGHAAERVAEKTWSSQSPKDAGEKEASSQP